MDTSESLLVDGTIIINSMDDYVKKSIYSEHHHHHGFFGFGSKSETITTRKLYHYFYGTNFKLALSLRQIAWYTLRLMEFPLPTFSKEFEVR